jgi:hypothetical protein
MGDENYFIMSRSNALNSSRPLFRGDKLLLYKPPETYPYPPGYCFHRLMAILPEQDPNPDCPDNGYTQTCERIEFGITSLNCDWKWTLIEVQQYTNPVTYLDPCSIWNGNTTNRINCDGYHVGDSTVSAGDACGNLVDDPVTYYGEPECRRIKSVHICGGYYLPSYVYLMYMYWPLSLSHLSFSQLKELA